MFLDIEQNTARWMDAGSGKVTGSKVSTIMANFGKAFGEPAKKLAVNIAVERLKGSRIEGERYDNKHMQAGHIEEPIARMMYEQITGNVVLNGGFYDNGNTGCSPDGRILFEKGLIEIKSVIPSTHFKTNKTNSFDSSYKWQLMFNMRETKSDFIDYVSFCDQYYSDKRLIIIRVLASENQESFDMIETRLAEFEVLIAEITAIIKGS